MVYPMNTTNYALIRNKQNCFIFQARTAAATQPTASCPQLMLRRRLSYERIRGPAAKVGLGNFMTRV